MRFLLILALASSTAAAEPYNQYAASPGPAPEPAPFRDAGYFGAGAALTHDHFFNAFVNLEGGIRPVVTVPLWLRASFAYGGTGDFEGTGRYLMTRAGVETRTCGGLACLFLGLDIGYQRQTWESQDEMDEHHEGPLVGARFGLDAGGERTRFRLGVEVYRYTRSSDVDQLPDSLDRGGGLSLSVIHRL